MFRDELEEYEAFERKLQRLAKMSAQEKRAYAKLIDRREQNWSDSHAAMTAEIIDIREFERETAADENYNHDQPV